MPDDELIPGSHRSDLDWEKALAKLEALAEELKPKRKRKDEDPQRPGRLVWVIRFDDECPSEWDLLPFTQSLGKRGSWNRPRASSPRRMSEQPPAFLTEQDRRAIKKLNLGATSNRGADLYSNNDAAIAELVDHPLLFADDQLAQPIELARPSSSCNPPPRARSICAWIHQPPRDALQHPLATPHHASS